MILLTMLPPPVESYLSPVDLLSDLLKDFLERGLARISQNVTDTVMIALPVGLGIAGLLLAVRLGIKFFRRVAR